ncbi:unnamed protein product [Merluccius merluccius]
MSGVSACEVIFISVSHSTTLMGKVWLIVMVFLRVVVLLLAGYPLYRDEQERFVCNTIQPGCANVCYDLFAPVSLFRFWLVQLVALSLPYLIFLVYVVHRVSSGLASVPAPPPPPQEAGAAFLRRGAAAAAAAEPGARGRCFAGAYLLQLVFRILLEVSFGAAHYYLFGFLVPSRFLCQQQPCTTQVDCYVSRPTEKSVMLCFMLGAGALSLALNALDVVCAVKRSVRQSGRRRRRRMAEKLYDEERYYLVGGGGGGTSDDAISLVHPEAGGVGASRPGSFRKRGASKASSVCGSTAAAAAMDHCSAPCAPVALTPGGGGGGGGPHGLNTNNGNNGYGSDAALCPPSEPPATPRSIRVNKRGRLKPPPPPRRDPRASSPPSLGSFGDIAKATTTTVGNRRGGPCAQVELGGGHDDDGQAERSEWV